MKILEFTLPAPEDKTIITKEESLPEFYPHLHRHNEVQITWILEGAGTLVADNNMHPFHNNEIYWIGANQPHVFRREHTPSEPAAPKSMHTLNIFFNIDTQLASFFSIPEVKHLKHFAGQHHSGFRVPQLRVPDISKKMRRINETSGLEQFLNFVDLLKHLSSCDGLQPLSSESRSGAHNEHEGLRIATIYNYILQHYQRQITLEEVAGIACMTPQAFCRYFKKYTNHTLVSFINEVRINEARKMLLDHQCDSIASVAYNTGFNSITNFNRVFKKIVKKSPKEFIDCFYQKVISQASILE
ncbi:AraC family transcriptional regulator [Paraflavisolibacter sp. H34]|uniref:AraC family transcriptional regulator n=1 Tax=Huijunlia imazamoxiresistens TaxID=3127457 RepID=UPI003015ABEF